MKTTRRQLNALSRRGFLHRGSLFLAGTLAGVSSACTVLDRRRRPPLRIAVLTDCHYADKAPAGSRHYRDSLAKVREAVARFNEAEASLAIELGDFVDAAPEVDTEVEYLKTIEAEYAKFHGDRHYVLGNHCVYTLTKEEFLDNCAARAAHYSFDVDDFHLVVLDACYRADGVAYGRRNYDWTDTAIPAPELEWPEEIRILLGSLQSEKALWALKGCISIRQTGGRLHPLRGSFVARTETSGLFGPAGWFLRNVYDLQQPHEQWLFDNQRGVVAAGLRLGRRRDAMPGDERAWNFPIDTVHWSELRHYARWAASLERLENGHVRIVLRAPEPQKQLQEFALGLRCFVGHADQRGASEGCVQIGYYPVAESVLVAEATQLDRLTRTRVTR